MKVLKAGCSGPQVQMLQLALYRAGYDPGSKSGYFDSKTDIALRKFQKDNDLLPDGVAGPKTHMALYPWYVGYTTHIVRSGDSLYRIAVMYGSTVHSIEIANPDIDPINLEIGSSVIVPLGFPVVPTDIDYCSQLISFCCRGIAARYPFVTLGDMGSSVMGKPLYTLTLGTGDNRVLYNAAHHANEWITVPVLLHFCEELAQAYAFGGEIYEKSARELLKNATLCIAPAVDPDGIDLVTGDLVSGSYYNHAAQIAKNYSEIPFPSGWKANILGTDLNLQYPAEWQISKEIKYALGFTSPAPRDFVGSGPLSAPESRAMYDFTRYYSPALTLSYHSQGETIYWKFLDYEPPHSQQIAIKFGEASGYFVEETPYESGFAGYKDWYIQDFFLPGYTIEVGLGTNPLPLSQFNEIYNDNLGILVLGLNASSEPDVK